MNVLEDEGKDVDETIARSGTVDLAKMRGNRRRFAGTHVGKLRRRHLSHSTHT